MAKIVVHPPFILSEWIDPKQKEKYIYRLELYGKITGNAWKADLEVILASHAIRSTGILQANTNYRIGCSEITVRIFGHGECRRLSSTPSIPIKGTYTQSLTINDQDSFTIAPAISQGEDKFEIASYESAQGRSTTHTVTFTCDERILADLPEKKGVEWTLKKPPGQTLLRDYIYGSFLLNAEFEWQGSERKGFIEIIPNELLVYNVKKGPGGKRASLLKRLYLYCVGTRVKHTNGVKFNFEIVDK